MEFISKGAGSTIPNQIRSRTQEFFCRCIRRIFLPSFTYFEARHLVIIAARLIAVAGAIEPSGILKESHL